MTGTSWWRRLFGGGKADGDKGGPGKGAQGKKASSGKSGKSGGKPAGRSSGASGKGSGASARPAGPTQPTGRPGRRASVDTSRPVLGVVPARTGWVGALLDPSGHGTPAIVSRAGLADLVQQAGEGRATVVAVAVPVGLPDDGPRDADRQTRSFMGAQGAGVFNAPVREAVYAGSYGDANTLNREKVGSGVARQAYELRAHIMEVDRLVRDDLTYVLVETHPEAGFTELAGGPVESKRRSHTGGEERRALLAAAGIHAPTTAPIGVSTEDMLDACAAAWTAHRVKNGEARTIPEQPQTFSDGLDSAIHL